MSKRAILATDLSKASDLLMDCLEEFKKLGIEHITLFHVPAISFSYMEYSGYSMQVHIEARMLNMQKRITEVGLSADFVFKEGLPSQEIVDYAGQHPDAIIILGSKGHGFLKRNLIGGTTMRVIQQSRNPVLMVRIKSLGKDDNGEPRCSLESEKICSHAILLTDFSRHSGEVFKYAEEALAARLDALSLMHVQDKVVMKHHDQATIDKFNRIDTARLNECTSSLRNKTNAPVFCVLAEGAVVPEIIREAKQAKASLIILGTHGKGYFSDMVLGSTASAVVQLLESNCLLIPFYPENT